ncbi:YkoF family thiamine/hydroxymethylpyrimidine-binding protein [Methylophaga sp. OBS3]|uniref:YkoF family thiamine/hydroxymethylpyrimidine-binding protein n=1 Tax=Methylophaga sp. OBS3 TaxID=2991934 RepID=UPI0022570C7D|nr:YkoF family thiamine/hydroxymethylpyrimidine-binding protein [Methylophaga sp. OBS3]MCX4190388.1 YkoF family thiamine/hydroxymethylpyrimidine-binding protein [Methylophaga sp. OBS3]
MRISVDISLYPLTEQYVEPILTFIDKLEANPALVVKRNSLSTQIFGEYADVMAAMDSEIEAIFAVMPHSAFVLKLVGTDRADVVDK